jgi:putative transposase
MARQRLPYATDLTDEAWQILKPLLPPEKSGGRPRKYPRREVINAIQYVLRGGGAWRLLPHDFPPWQIVYHDFWSWRQDGTWPLMHDLLRGNVRVGAGKHRQPSAGLLDSPSVKTTKQGGSAALTHTSRSRAAHATSSSIPSGSS